MSVATYLLGVLAALFTLIVVIELLRRRRLRERHAAWWLMAGALALVVGVFPGILDGIADRLGVEEPVNLVFFVSIAILVLVCIQHSAELTTLESRIRTLAEQSAMHDDRLRSLEAQGSPDAPTSTPGP